MLLGCHLSIAGGIDKSIDRAQNLGINALQIFSHNPRSWGMRPLKEGEDSTFILKRKACDIEYAVIHTSYLINLASPEDDLYRKSIEILKQEIDRADRLQIKHIVTHIGAHRGQGLKDGINRAGCALLSLREYLSGTKTGVKLLLENTAGSGTTVGSTFSQLKKLFDIAQFDNNLLGFCFDTAHALACGYDLFTNKGLEDTISQMGSDIGYCKLGLIHLNDSKYEIGSRKDGHEHIGKGHIGIGGLKGLINHPRLRHLPFILETPKTFRDGSSADEANLNRVLAIRDRAL